MGQKSFDIIGLPLDAVYTYKYNKSEKVAAPLLASKSLLDQVRERIRYLHYSLKIEKACYLSSLMASCANLRSCTRV
jgi:hypothetical protein